MNKLKQSGKSLPLPWLNSPRVLELSLVAADDLAHRRARYRQGAHDLLDRAVLLKIGASYLADQVHANHPPSPSRPVRPKERMLTEDVREGLHAVLPNEIAGDWGYRRMTAYSGFVVPDRDARRHLPAKLDWLSDGVVSDCTAWGDTGDIRQSSEIIKRTHKHRLTNEGGTAGLQQPLATRAVGSLLDKQGKL